MRAIVSNAGLLAVRLGSSLLAVSLGTGCALYSATAGKVAVSNMPATVAVQFGERDRALIRDYYGKQRHRAPPGFAKRERLPPGLVKRRTLPPGLQGRGLPSTLEARLSRLPAAYMRLVIDADVAIIERATRVVIDVIYGVAA